MLDRWQLDLLSREYLALESGAFAQKMAQKMNIQATADFERETTSSDRMNAAERALHNQCANAVVVSVGGVLASKDNERLVRFILGDVKNRADLPTLHLMTFPLMIFT